MIERRFHKKMNKELNADFSDLLEEKEIKTEPAFDFTEELKEKKKYKINVIRYYRGSPVIYEKGDYIVLVSNRNLTIVNTNPDAEEKNHIHISTKTNKNGKVNLNLVKYMIDTCLNKKYPKQEWMVSYLLRLTIDEEYILFLTRKRTKNKQKQIYKNKKG